MIRVLLADDHEIVRLGLRSVLEGAEDIDVVGEVATAEAAVSAAQAGGIDVTLMDLRFGAGWQRSIRYLYFVHRWRRPYSLSRRGNHDDAPRVKHVLRFPD